MNDVTDIPIDPNDIGWLSEKKTISKSMFWMIKECPLKAFFVMQKGYPDGDNEHTVLGKTMHSWLEKLPYDYEKRFDSNEKPDFFDLSDKGLTHVIDRNLLEDEFVMIEGYRYNSNELIEYENNCYNFMLNMRNSLIRNNINPRPADVELKLEVLVDSNVDNGIGMNGIIDILFFGDPNEESVVPMDYKSKWWDKYRTEAGFYARLCQRAGLDVAGVGVYCFKEEPQPYIPYIRDINDIGFKRTLASFDKQWKEVIEVVTERNAYRKVGFNGCFCDFMSECEPHKYIEWRIKNKIKQQKETNEI